MYKAWKQYQPGKLQYKVQVGSSSTIIFPIFKLQTNIIIIKTEHYRKRHVQEMWRRNLYGLDCYEHQDTVC